MTPAATRKPKPQRKPGLLIDVARFISASQDRSTGRVVFRDEQGRLVALRMRRRQFQTFSSRADALAGLLDE